MLEGVGVGVCDGAGEECWREWEWEYVMGQEKRREWEYVMGQEKSVGGSGSGSM